MISEPGDGRIYVTTPDGLWSFNSSAHNVPRAAFDALRERCGKLDVALHIAAQDLAFVAGHSANIQLATMARKASNDAYAARSAAKASGRTVHLRSTGAVELWNYAQFGKR